MNLMIAFCRALNIIGIYISEAWVYLWPILYDNAIIPLIKRNFGLILTLFPQIQSFNTIAYTLGTVQYGIIYFITEYIIMTILIILTYFI